jgi:Cytochrome c-type biogenesis protein CcmE
MFAVGSLVVGVAVAAIFAFSAFRNNMMYFYTPTDIADHTLPKNATVELGGLVEKGSIVRGAGLAIRFMVTDCHHQLPVTYDGVLPDLFREGQGIVATGRVDGAGTFVATRILAKHDSTYMPPNVARQMKTADEKGRRDCGAFKSEPPVPDTKTAMR